MIFNILVILSSAALLLGALGLWAQENESTMRLIHDPAADSPDAVTNAIAFSDLTSSEDGSDSAQDLAVANARAPEAAYEGLFTGAGAIERAAEFGREVAAAAEANREAFARGRESAGRADDEPDLPDRVARSALIAP